MKELLTEFLVTILKEASREFKAVRKGKDGKERVVPFGSKESMQKAIATPSTDGATYRPYNPATDGKLEKEPGNQPSTLLQPPPAKGYGRDFRGITPQKPAPVGVVKATTVTSKASPENDENQEGSYDPKDKLQAAIVEAKTDEELYSSLDALGEEEARLMYDEGIAGAGGPVASTGETMCTETQTDLIQGRYNAEEIRQSPQYKTTLSSIEVAISGAAGKRKQTVILNELNSICVKFGFITPEGKPDTERAKSILAEAHTFVESRDEVFKQTKVAREKFKTEEDRQSWLRASFYSSYSLMNNGPSNWDRKTGNGRVLKANARTDGAIKKLLEDKLKSSMKSNDTAAVEHYQTQLDAWEKFKGYHDTYMVYTNTDGRTSIYHISNKKGDDLLDPQNNTTPEKRLETYAESAKEANLSPEQAKIIGDAQSVAVSAVENIDAIAVGAYGKLDSVQLIGALATRLPRKSQTDVSREYFESLRNDRAIKAYFKAMGKNAEEMGDEEVIVAAKELVEKANGDLSGFSGNFSKFIIKLGQLSQSVYEKAKADKSPEEISKMFNGAYSPEEISEILNDENMKMLSEVKAQHASGLVGVHKGFIDALHSADGTEAGHVEDNGPAVETYVRGTIKALHLDTYITNFDNIVQIEMGGVGVTPVDARGCMAKLSGYTGNIDTAKDRQQLIDHLAKKVKLDSNSDAVYLVGNNGKRTYIATDTWRQAGSGKKIATGFGADLRKCLQNSVATRLSKTQTK